MNNIEKNEIASLPEKYRPIGAWAYFGLSILYSVPIIGFIFLIIHSLSSANVNRRSFARSFFCIVVICLIIAGITALCGGFAAGLTALTNMAQSR